MRDECVSYPGLYAMKRRNKRDECVTYLLLLAFIKLACITGAFYENGILREARDQGRRKIKRLLPVHCSGSSHVHYMNVAFQLVNSRSSQSIKIGIDKNRSQSNDFY